MRARVAIRSQWKDLLLIDTFPSLTLGKLFTEEGRREISSLTTIFVAECRIGRSVLYSTTKPWIRLAVVANGFDSDSFIWLRHFSICNLIQTRLCGIEQLRKFSDWAVDRTRQILLSGFFLLRGYNKVSDVVESWVRFASKNLTPRRMH